VAARGLDTRVGAAGQGRAVFACCTSLQTVRVGLGCARLLQALALGSGGGGCGACLRARRLERRRRPAGSPLRLRLLPGVLGRGGGRGSRRLRRTL